MRANLELSPELLQYLNLLYMDEYKPTTHAARCLPKMSQTRSKKITSHLCGPSSPNLSPTVIKTYTPTSTSSKIN